jgi:hypothetical protein
MIRTNKGAVGVVCQSPEGKNVRPSVVIFDGITHPGCLEAMACREALVTAADLHLGPIHVASDCLEVVKGLKGECMGAYASILREVREGAALRGNSTFVHEERKSNGEAHRLARFASSLPSGRYVWFIHPPYGVNIPINLVNLILGMFGCSKKSIASTYAKKNYAQEKRSFPSKKTKKNIARAERLP